MVYGSTPIAVSLFLLFALNRQWKKAAVVIVPNILYILYFVYVSLVAEVAPSRVLEAVSIFALLKQFGFQVVTFVDAVLGPSMWLKVYYSFSQLSMLSWLVGIVLVVGLYVVYKPDAEKYNVSLLVSLTVLMLSSFAMFAVTGRYPQLAFNLGNRTTFWGSLLVAYTIVLMPSPRVIKVGIYGVFIFSMLGISDHWKAWSLHQQLVVSRIQNNQALRAVGEDTEIFVSGNQYSKFGPISHIEFLSEDWVPQAIFDLTLPHHLSVRAFNKNYRFRDGYLEDFKHCDRQAVVGYINVYDSERDVLLRVKADEIDRYIEALPKEKRHWTMMTDQGFVGWLKDLAIFFMPRLKGYLRSV